MPRTVAKARVKDRDGIVSFAKWPALHVAGIVDERVIAAIDDPVVIKIAVKPAGEFVDKTIVAKNDRSSGPLVMVVGAVCPS